MYYSRIIDSHLQEWAQRKEHKPLLLKEARQIGKLTAGAILLGTAIEEFTGRDRLRASLAVTSCTNGGKSRCARRSLWEFMREKGLIQGIRCSLENFCSFDYTDEKASNVIRHITVCPLYAISQIPRLMSMG